MGQRRKPGASHERAADQHMRDQELLRAKRELTAYFKGRRTEREARAALKIIKAFVRNRERQDAKSRSPLPGINVATRPKEIANRKDPSDGNERSRRRVRRKPQGAPSKSMTPAIELQPNPEVPQRSESAGILEST